MNDNKTIYFPAISVGSALSVLKKDTKHITNGGSYRFGTKGSLLYHPYILVSAAHAFEDLNFRENIGFDKEGLFFGDSGGFQLFTNKAKKGFGVERASEWLNATADIFPILDYPINKGSGALSDSEIEDCAKKSLKNAIYFQKNRTKGKKILNVLHGRNDHERNIWYEQLSRIKFQGWAYGGTNLMQIISSFFFLLEKGEFEHSEYFHVFGISKPKYIIYFEYMQKLLNQQGYKTIITFDSSYPFRTCAFGNYFLYPSMEGVPQMKFTNTIEYSHLPQDAVLPCICPVCKDVPIKEFAQFKTDKFYAITSFHNLYKLIEFKLFIERLINMSCDALLKEAFKSCDYKLLMLLKRYMEDDKPNRTKRIIKDLGPLLKNDLDLHETSLGDMF